MAKIKVTRGGCGIKYIGANGAARYVLKTPESGSFECDDAQASRLVNMGVAIYTAIPSDNPIGHLVAAELEALDYNELKKLAADMGVKPEGQKKSDYVAAIASVDILLDDESDEMPEPNTAEPE